MRVPPHRLLWLIATGEELPVLETLWRLYLTGRSRSPLTLAETREKQDPWMRGQCLCLDFRAVDRPAKKPKPREKSPGWPIGKKRTPKTRFPTIKLKKRDSKPKAQAKSTA